MKFDIFIALLRLIIVNQYLFFLYFIILNSLKIVLGSKIDVINYL